MKKIEIEGMHCMHCVAAVEQALKALSLEKVEVSLQDNCALVDGSASDEELKSAVEDLGFGVVKIVAQ